ncbi:MAG: preprotein translocase subunit YajC [Planctomycetes bacterium]|nr:preprotein translocase subunit YajC [Planctomycetota bacterium]
MIEPLAQANSQGTGAPLLIGLMIAMGVFFFITTRGQRREKKRRQQMLDGMAKNDRVMTIGGIVGTIVSVKEKEVVVKVDESTNTKMTFSKRAIQQLIDDDSDLALDNR